MKKDMKEERQFLLFAGTKEGRELAEYMSAHRISAVVCVATEYGEELLRPDRWIQVHTGRMEKAGMEDMIRKMEPLAVIDATHPYADVVTANIRDACETCGAAYYRLMREESAVKDSCLAREISDVKDSCPVREEFAVKDSCPVKDHCFAREEAAVTDGHLLGEEESDRLRFFANPQEAAHWLKKQEGNILLTTGIKELPCFAETISDRGRIYVRALLQNDIFKHMEKYGLSRKQIICMQGPFSAEMNVATLRMTGAKYLVTKESGAAGGFAEKVEAARACGAVGVVIRRPTRETGYSAKEVQKIVLEKWAVYSVSESECVNSNNLAAENISAGDFGEKPIRRITLLGIGMGSRGSMTTEAVQACERADCIIGAKRMLETLQEFGKAMVPLYLSDEIAAYVEAHPEYRNIVVAFSGDVGFYSGAKKLLEQWKAQDKTADKTGNGFPGTRVLAGDHGGVEIRLLPGISSVAYFAARLQIPWEDMTLVSSHGREQNLVGAVRTSEKVFTLASDAASIRRIAQKLVMYGLGTSEMYVGCDLSYPTEKIYEGSAAGFADFDQEGMCVALICNPNAGEAVVTHGIPDEAFLRAKVPMTKEEVRSISLSKLQLTRDSVVYDVGAGTGSVSVECARMADRGRVYAIEWKEDAWKLIAENRKKFAVANLEIVPGRAPDVFEKLPAPTHVFIGGSGGSLRAILTALLRKNPEVRIVMNCVTLETLTEILTTARELGLDLEDVASVSVAKAARAGKYHLMTGQNPVYVITLAC